MQQKAYPNFLTYFCTDFHISVFNSVFQRLLDQNKRLSSILLNRKSTGTRGATHTTRAWKRSIETPYTYIVCDNSGTS